MRKLKFLTFLYLFGTVSLFGYTHPCPGGWDLEAYFLYLQPSIDDTYFVLAASADVSELPSGQRKNNDFDFRPGFRIGGAYAFCDCNREFRVYYTRLHATTSRDVSGSILSATQGPPDMIEPFQAYEGSASSRLDALYHRVDAFFDQKVYGCCNLDLYLEWGLEFASARLKENIEYIESDATPEFATFNQRAKTWGIGPQIGLEIDYNICQFRTCCPGNLSLVTIGSASILASKTLVRFTEIDSNTAVIPLELDNDRTWRLIPALHAWVGLNYNTCFSCFGLSLEVGYEFNSYIRSLSRAIFPDDVADGLSFNNFINFDLQGLYVAAGLTF